MQKEESNPPNPLREEKNEEIKPNFEGLYFTIALSTLAQIWYVGSWQWREFAV